MTRNDVLALINRENELLTRYYDGILESEGSAAFEGRPQIVYIDSRQDRPITDSIERLLRYQTLLAYFSDVEQS